MPGCGPGGVERTENSEGGREVTFVSFRTFLGAGLASICELGKNQLLRALPLRFPKWHLWGALDLSDPRSSRRVVIRKGAG